MLVDRSLARSRSEAQRLIAEGSVRVGGVPAAKPAQQIPAGADISVEAGHRPVGRGGAKLAAAFEAFPIRVAGRSAVDVGASTGGFTEVLLRRGARRVVAVDVGHGQLHPRLRAHPRVVSFERTDIRGLDVVDAGGPFGLVVVDVSFVSVAKLLPAITGAAEPGADLVVLVKPQFEVGRAVVGKGGVVRSEAARGRAVEAVIGACREAGFRHRGTIRSPVTGADGNQEFLVWFTAPAAGP